MADALRRQQKTQTVLKLYENRLKLEHRNGTPMFYARTYVQGKQLVKSTGETTQGAAVKVATNWYLSLLDRVRRGESLHALTFGAAAEAFLKHADERKEVSEGQRRNYRQKWSLLKPFFEGVKLSDVDASFLLRFRDTRAASKAVSNATIKKDLNFVSLVLRHAKEFIKSGLQLPEFPAFRGEKWAVAKRPRPILDLHQWRTLRNLAKQRADVPDLNARTRQQRLETYCFLMLCMGAALRVGEAYSVRWKDCRILHLNDADKTQALQMKVLGKHSRGGQREDAWGLYGAVSAYQRLKKARPDAKPDEPLFTEKHHESVKLLLEACNLRVAENGRTRDSKSLRPSAISLRLDAGPSIDVRDVAKWARTSPAQIQDFYDQTHPEKSVERVTGFRGKR